MNEKILGQTAALLSRSLTILAVLICQANLAIALGDDSLEFDELIEIAKRYDCPQPPKNSVLIVGWSGSWRTIGQSNSNHAGIYQPGFALNKDSKEGVEVLMGFAKVICKSRKTIPATRDFILSSPDEVRDGYSISHNHLSNFETCVQLARMGRKELANELWDKFSTSRFIDGGHPQENTGELLSNPKALLARSIFEHYKAKTLRPDSNWREISRKLDELRIEFPELFSAARNDYNEYYRNQFVDDLRVSLEAEQPTADTVEESLLKWANSNGEMRHLGFYDSHNVAADAPVREIFNRGVESIKPLVELVDDRRLTLHVRSAVNNAREYRLRVGDLAKMLLRKISGANSPAGNQWVTEAPRLWQEWFEKTDFSNESQFLETAAFDVNNGQAYEVPIRVLDVRHPTDFVRLVKIVSRNATPNTYCHYVTYAIRDSAMPIAEKSRLLSMMFRELPDKQKRTAIQALAHINKNLTSGLVLPLIKKLPSDVDEPYWTSEAANLTHVVMHLDDIEVWSAYLRAAKKATVGLRMEMMEPMNYSYIDDTNEKFRLAFLSSFLDDETVRDIGSDKQKFAGPCAAFTFKKICVRDYVTMKLASLLLKSKDYPDDSWTPSQWDELRRRVRSRLAKQELPNISVVAKED